MNIYIASAIVAMLAIWYIYRNKQAKSKVVRVICDNCTGCGRCIKRCRRNVLNIIENDAGKHVVVENSQKCTACGDCIAVCKFNALELAIRD